MTSSKTPKARHARLLSNGFFPPEMPSCFYSERFGAQRDAILVALDQVPSKKAGTPHYYFHKGERAVFTFPRFRREDRRHSYINPISYFYLSKALAEKYIAMRKLNRRSKMSIAPAIFDWKGERALIRPAFDARDSQRVTLNAGYELLAEADVNAFFHSIYTHTIPWAIHGKAVAKKKKQDMSLYGNVLDLLVRNAQDGQTIGLPVGPDTSRLLAEIVGTAIDKLIQTTVSKSGWSAKRRGAMRFVDDFTFGCMSHQQAEIAVAAIRRCVNEFELELNNTKTKILPTGPFFPTAWKEHIRSILPTGTVGKSELLQYFYRVEAAVAAHPEANVQKFALQNARRLFLEASEWSLIEDYLLSSYRQNPTVLSIVLEILILRQLDKQDVSIDRISAFVTARIATLSRLQKHGEICWLLFLCIGLRAPIPSSALSSLFDVEDSAIAILISDANKQHLVSGLIDQSKWDSNLTADGLRSSMWLYAYESALKGINSTATSSHVVADPYFGPMFSLNVEFYRSGSSHMNRNTLLSRLRLMRLRHAAQQAAVEEDLAEEFFDFEEEEVDDSESDLY